MNFIALFAAIIENLENLKYHNSQKKHQFFLLFAVSAIMKVKSYLKKKNQLKN